MSRYTHFQFRGEREGRVAQMTKQEQVIARKKQELLEKQKTTELAKQVAAAQCSSAKIDKSDDDSCEQTNKASDRIKAETSTSLKNNFNNDGSFLENFKKITEAAAKKAEEERMKLEKEIGAEPAETENDPEMTIEDMENENSDANRNQEKNQNPQRKRHNPHNITSTNANNIPSLLSLPIQAPPNLCAPIAINEIGSVPPPPPPPPALPHQFSMQPPPLMPSQPVMGPSMLSFASGMPPLQIPPPKPMVLNAIPQPRELDLTAIPEPQMNVGAIKIPDLSMQHNTIGGINYNIDNQNVNEHGPNNELTRNINQINNLNTNNLMNNIPHGIDQSYSMHSDHNKLMDANLMLTSIPSSTSQTSTGTYPTTVEGLIELVILNGDHYEDKMRLQFNDLERTPFWFLNEKGSLAYRNYRQQVDSIRTEKLATPPNPQQSSSKLIEENDKYDPEDILHYDDEEIAHSDNLPPATTTTNPSLMTNAMDSIRNEYDNSDDNDSDNEYMQETKERNLRNLKEKITSSQSFNKDEYDRPYNVYKNYTNDDYSDDDDDDDDDDSYHTNEDDHMEMYNKIQMRENALDEFENFIQELPKDQKTDQQPSESYSRFQQNQQTYESQEAQEQQQPQESTSISNKRKRSRWGEKVTENAQTAAGLTNPHKVAASFGNQNKPLLSAVTRSDPALLNYARQNYGTINLSEEDWQKCEEHYKVNLLFQDLVRKREEIDRLAKSGKFKYEYDSDEDTAGGTWEHKLRMAEMDATAAWADAITKQSQGKHHIGDFLPPEELKKFMEQYNSRHTNREPDLSDYKEFKLNENNKGFQMLQKLGWKEGQGLGFDGAGIVDPINKATQRDSNQGLGSIPLTRPEAGDNEYDAYRKRMMLAYRFRPNPLNNPRRAYY